MDFGDALRALQAGDSVQRRGWNGKDMWLSLYSGHPALPAILMGWLASQTDMLAEDWRVL